MTRDALSQKTLAFGSGAAFTTSKNELMKYNLRLVGRFFVNWKYFTQGICKIRGKIFHESFSSIIATKTNSGAAVDTGETDKLTR